jgi:hypothetical protein
MGRWADLTLRSSTTSLGTQGCLLIIQWQGEKAERNIILYPYSVLRLICREASWRLSWTPEVCPEICLESWRERANMK